MWFMR